MSKKKIDAYGIWDMELSSLIGHKASEEEIEKFLKEEEE